MSTIDSISDLTVNVCDFGIVEQLVKTGNLADAFNSLQAYVVELGKLRNEEKSVQGELYKAARTVTKIEIFLMQSINSCNSTEEKIKQIAFSAKYLDLLDSVYNSVEPDEKLIGHLCLIVCGIFYKMAPCQSTSGAPEVLHKLEQANEKLLQRLKSKSLVALNNLIDIRFGSIKYALANGDFEQAKGLLELVQKYLRQANFNEEAQSHYLSKNLGSSIQSIESQIHEFMEQDDVQLQKAAPFFEELMDVLDLITKADGISGYEKIDAFINGDVFVDYIYGIVDQVYQCSNTDPMQAQRFVSLAYKMLLKRKETDSDLLYLIGAQAMALADQQLENENIEGCKQSLDIAKKVAKKLDDIQLSSVLGSNILLLEQKLNRRDSNQNQ